MGIFCCQRNFCKQQFIYCLLIKSCEWLLFKEHFFSQIKGRTSYFLMPWGWNPLCTRPIPFIGSFIYMCSANLLKQTYVGRHVAPLRHIILISRQTVFDFTHWTSVLSKEAANINCIVFGLTPWTHDLPHSRRARYPLHHWYR